MNEPLDELYFRWLYSQVASPNLKNPSRSHWKLLLQMFKKEFVWVVARDDNRVADGKDLRREFLYDAEISVFDNEWIEMGCSFLELLIGLARHLTFMAEGEMVGWFWEMVQNLGLEGYNDRANYSRELVDATIDRVMWRQYNADGTGGLFPLKNSRQDQRTIEIWYQMCAYAIELEERREDGLL